MNQRARTFIEKRLIPFVLREHGMGFAMETWYSDVKGLGESVYSYDSVPHTEPKCGTVACLGGSVQVLLARSSRDEISRARIAKAIGLSSEQASGLFNNWYGNEDEGREFGWPKRFARRFEDAKTALGKAKVAVALLREVVKTNGECLRYRTRREPVES